MRTVIRSPEDWLSIHDLDRAIVNLAARINAAREKVRVAHALKTGELVEKALDKARDDSRRAGPRSRRAGSRSKLFNNPPAGGLLTGMKSFVSEPEPPVYCY